jgi:hypothetical protein
MFQALRRLPQNQTQRDWTTGNGGIMRSLMPRMASARMQVPSRAQCWQGTGWGAGRGVSHVEKFRKQQAGSVAPGTELNLALALVAVLIVPERKLGHGLSVISVATNFPGPDESAADRRNGFRGSSLLSCVVRSVGGEQQK